MVGVHVTCIVVLLFCSAYLVKMTPYFLLVAITTNPFLNSLAQALLVELLCLSSCAELLNEASIPWPFIWDLYCHFTQTLVSNVPI